MPTLPLTAFDIKARVSYIYSEGYSMSILKKVNENLRAKSQSDQALDKPAIVANTTAPGSAVITEVFRPYTPLPAAPVVAEQPTTGPPGESNPPKKRRVGRPMKEADLVPGEKLKRGVASAVPGVVRDKIVSFGATAYERTVLVEEALRLDMSLSAMLRQAVFAGLNIPPPHPEKIEIQGQGPLVRGAWLDKLKNLNTMDDVTRLMKTLEVMMKSEGGRERVEQILKDQTRKRKKLKAQEREKSKKPKGKEKRT